MKISGHYQARKVHANGESFVMLRVLDKNADALLESFFLKKLEKDKQKNIDSHVKVTFELPYRKKSYKQLKTVFALVTAIFVSMEGRLPTEDEKYDLYLDLLDVYAIKKPSKIDKLKLRACHISESNSFEAAYFISGLMQHLAESCDLSLDIQTDVRELLWEWEAHRGMAENDPLDYYDKDCTKPLSEADWRIRHSYSEASGLTGNIQLHHIVTRGENPLSVNEVWNWCALTAEEHALLHQEGEVKFLKKFSHLVGKFRRAQKKSNELTQKKKLEIF